MADIPASSFRQEATLPMLAPDLTFPSTVNSSSIPYATVTGINAVGSLTTALSITGKWAIGLLAFANVALEAITIKLTVDGVVIWNSSFTPSNTTIPLIGGNGVGFSGDISIRCESSLLLEIQTTADTSVDLRYTVRPIL